MAEIGLPVSGTQQISTGFASWLHYCSDVAHRRPTKLCAIFGGLLGWYTIYTFSGLLPPDGILPRAKFTLCQNLAFYYIGSVIAQHSSSGHQPNFAAFSIGRHLYSAGHPSHCEWSAHILVVCLFRFNILCVFCFFSLDSFVLFAFVILGLVSSVLCQEIGWEEHLCNDLFCGKCDVNVNQSVITVYWKLERIRNVGQCPTWWPPCRI